MHDAKGRPLVPGDTVLVPFKVTQTHATEEYCNASLETVATMHPGTHTTTLTVNTRQVLRSNDGDDNSSWTVTRHGDDRVTIE